MQDLDGPHVGRSRVWSVVLHTTIVPTRLPVTHGHQVPTLIDRWRHYSIGGGGCFVIWWRDTVKSAVAFVIGEDATLVTLL